MLQLSPRIAAVLTVLLAAGCSTSDAEDVPDSGGAGGSTQEAGPDEGAPQPDAGPDVPGEASADAAPEASTPTLVATIETSMGTIKVALNETAAPVTVDNFAKYADAHYFDGLLFHRVIPDFMIQGGGLEPGMIDRPELYPPIVNEASSSGLSNVRGSIAMARTSDPDSATSQFFINTEDNDFLDPGPSQPDGYAVFGEVIDGMDVVDAIKVVETHSVGQYDDVPVEDVLITSISVAQQ
jgi:cyclophilin family peptidyl-prolyl cis-trans isomerase